MERLPIRLSQASGVPFYRQIVDQLSDLIRSGQLPPSTRLPSFRELAPQLLVSLITVRRAYADLEAAGLISRRQGQGTFVASEFDSSLRKRALADAHAKLEAAVVRARQLGLRGPALRAVVTRLIAAAEREDARDAKTQKGQEDGHH